MKFTFTLLLIFQFLTVNLFGREVVELPNLYKHYQKHNLESKTPVSLLDFVYMHYFDDNHTQNDSEHNDLPFQHQHSETLILYKDFQFQTPLKSKHETVSDIPYKIPLTDEKGFNSMVVNVVFQPPKNVV
ncbi:MAG: hypothetical protein K1X92_00820 [Bacteroidia bacterium]|nr:hypothetical protein [Bacteroidia bacterium]